MLLTVFQAGCGGSDSYVSGKILLDGQPLAGSQGTRVTIMYYPVSGGAPAAALADEDGQYTLATGAQAGLSPGSYAVVISATRVGESTESGGPPRKQLVTPEKYANPLESGLRAEVKPGSNTFDFELQSKPTG